MYICIKMLLYIHIHMYIHMYTCIHMHIHIHAYIYTDTCPSIYLAINRSNYLYIQTYSAGIRAGALLQK